jgi:viologen exporter family transport system permease protein
VTNRSARALERYRTFTALVSAGFRRYSTYRQATVAGLFTNIVFGFLRCYVLLAVVGQGTAGYDPGQITTYVWVSQGMIATVGLWGEVGLADRIRTGDVVADLLRPVPPVESYLATDLGRAGFAAVTRFVGPVLVGALAFDLRWPQRPATYPLFAVSVLLATVICFGCRYLTEAAAYWLLDARGPRIAWTLASNALTGLVFPLSFLPVLVSGALWALTPFPWLLQAPVDILVERPSALGALGLVAGQVVWAVIMLGAAGYVQRLGTRRLVIQGG